MRTLTILSMLGLVGGLSASTAPGRGVSAPGPWLSFYGQARQAGDLNQLAHQFRLINIDADPHLAHFTPEQIHLLKAGGTNRVISYLNVGACESFRDYWQSVPAPFVACARNQRAQRGPYLGYPEEVWMDPSDPDYQSLIVDHVARRLIDQGADGFFLDNLEIVEHGPRTKNGPCDARCAQGGLDLVARLRHRFPDRLIIMQNATGAIARNGRTVLGPFPALLDGVAHESVFTPTRDDEVVADLLAWRALGLRPGGHPFWIGTEDYLRNCHGRSRAKGIYGQSRTHGFSPYVSDASSGQQRVCYWPF